MNSYKMFIVVSRISYLFLPGPVARGNDTAGVDVRVLLKGSVIVDVR